MEVANTLAYYNAATITAVKCFIVQAPGVCIIKLFTAVINSVTSKASVFVKVNKKFLTISKTPA
jgi:hypothetical protein